MHIADITLFYCPQGGGVSTYLSEKAHWLARCRQIRHTIFSSSIGAAHCPPGVTAMPGLPIPGIANFRLPLGVAGPARLLRQAHPDLIEVGDASPCAWAALRERRRASTPVVAFCHSNLPQLVARRFGSLGGRAAARYLRHLYLQADLVLAPSQSMVRQLGAIGVAGAVRQPLGVNSRIFRPQCRNPDLRRQLGLSADTRLLVYAGRFVPEKNLSLLGAAVRRLGPAYHLLLIGGGAAPAPSAQMTVVAFQSEPQRLACWLASCDVLVHPGDCETFGLIVLEAMACGLPVVGTSGGAVAELLDPGSGVLVPPNSVDGLCAGIEAIYRGDLLQLGVNARRKAVRDYDWNCVLPQLLKLYAGLLSVPQRVELEAGIQYALN